MLEHKHTHTKRILLTSQRNTPETVECQPTHLKWEEAVVDLDEILHAVLIEDGVFLQGGGGLEGAVLAVHQVRVVLLALLHKQDVEHLLLVKQTQTVV